MKLSWNNVAKAFTLMMMLHCQEVVAQISREQLVQRSAQSAEALGRFLDSSLDEEDRISAGQQIAASPETAEKLLEFAADEMAPESLRGMAIILSGRSRPAEASAICEQLLKSKSGSPELRSTCVHYLSQQLEFGTSDVKSNLLELVRNALSEQEAPAVRMAALSYLSQRGDDKAVQVLRRAIVSPEGALLDQSQAIGYASSTPDLYVEQFAQVFENGNAKAKSEVISSLASYPEFQPKILKLLENANDNTPFEVRNAAATSLSHYFPESIGAILRIAADKNENEALRTTCLAQLGVARSKYGDRFEEVSPVSSDQISNELNILMRASPTKGMNDAIEAYLNQ